MIPGYDGVGEIVKCGHSSQDLKPGDRVILKRHGLGTWRTHAALSTSDVLRVPNDMDISAAAILRMSILNAYLLLHNNAQHTHPGDWILVNAATSTVAHFLIQFANAKGLHVICVIRDRDDAAKTKQMLQRHGAALVWEEKDMPEAEAIQSKKITLAFDAVFGEAGQKLISALTPGAKYVAFGFLGDPGPGAQLVINQELIWLKDITFCGFRLSKALLALSGDEQEALFAHFSRQLHEGQLTMPMLDLVNWPGDGEVEVLKKTVADANSGEMGRQKKVIVFP